MQSILIDGVGKSPIYRAVVFFAFYGKKQLLSSTLFHAKAQSPQRKTKINYLRILASLRLCERILFNSGLSGLGITTVIFPFLFCRL